MAKIKDNFLSWTKGNVVSSISEHENNLSFLRMRSRIVVDHVWMVHTQQLLWKIKSRFRVDNISSEEPTHITSWSYKLLNYSNVEDKKYQNPTLIWRFRRNLYLHGSECIYMYWQPEEYFQQMVWTSFLCVWVGNVPGFIYVQWSSEGCLSNVISLFQECWPPQI